MKIHFNPRYLALFLGLSVFIACKKDDAPPTPNPVPEETPEQILFGKIQGRWEVDIPVPPRTRSSNPVSSKTQEGYNVASVEFLSDSTFILGTDYTYASSGIYTIEDSTSVQLGDVATISNISFSDDEISFTVTLSEEMGGETMSTVAKKVEPIDTDEDKAPFLRNWELVINEGDENYFTNMASEFEADRVKRLYTAYGTVFTQFFDGDEFKRGIVTFWKWHSNIEDAFVEYEHAEQIPDNKYAKITALTANALTVEETIIEEGASEPHVAYTLQYTDGTPVATRKK